MHRLATAAVAAALVVTMPACITTYGVYKHQENVSKVDIITAGALDLGAGAFFLYAAEDQKPAVAIVSAIVITAVDLGVACLLGTCQVLHP